MSVSPIQGISGTADCQNLKTIKECSSAGNPELPLLESIAKNVFKKKFNIASRLAQQLSKDTKIGVEYFIRVKMSVLPTRETSGTADCQNLQTIKKSSLTCNRKNNNSIDDSSLLQRVVNRILADDFKSAFYITEQLTKESREKVKWILSYPFIGPAYVHKAYNIARIFRAKIVQHLIGQNVTNFSLSVVWLRANIVAMDLLNQIEISPMNKGVLIVNRKDGSCFVVINLTNMKIQADVGEKEDETKVNILLFNEPPKFNKIVLDPHFRFAVFFPYEGEVTVMAAEEKGGAVKSDIELTAYKLARTKTTSSTEFRFENITSAFRNLSKVQDAINGIDYKTDPLRAMAIGNPFSVSDSVDFIFKSTKVYQCGLEIIFHFKDLKKAHPHHLSSLALEDYKELDQVYSWAVNEKTLIMLAPCSKLNENTTTTKMYGNFKIQHGVDKKNKRKEITILDNFNQPRRKFQQLPMSSAGLFLSQFVGNVWVRSEPPSVVYTDSQIRLYKICRNPEVSFLFKQNGIHSFLWVRDDSEVPLGWHSGEFECTTANVAMKQYQFVHWSLDFRQLLITVYEESYGTKVYELREIDLKSQEAKAVGVSVDSYNEKETLVLQYLTPVVDTEIIKVVKSILEPMNKEVSLLVKGYLFNL